MDEDRAADTVKRYSGFDNQCNRVIRVFAARPREALVIAKKHQPWYINRGPKVRHVRVRCVVEDPMAQVTRGD